MGDELDIFTQAQLLDAWVAHRSAGRPFHRLREPRLQAFEYKGPRLGHPSSYAAVRFRCAPGDDLTFRSEATWPEQLSASDRAALLRAIAVAIVDGLLSHFYPYRGCQLTLIGVGWDDISSSEFAFYLATRAAMEELRTADAWAISPVTA